ncbi:Uncharacterized protein YkfH, partial [Salmonella enterica subsp. enterica serovar Rissen]
ENHQQAPGDDALPADTRLTAGLLLHRSLPLDRQCLPLRRSSRTRYQRRAGCICRTPSGSAWPVCTPALCDPEL